MVRAAGFEPAVCPAKDSALEAVASTEFRHARDKCHKGERKSAPRRVRGGPLIFYSMPNRSPALTRRKEI